MLVEQRSIMRPFVTESLVQQLIPGFPMMGFGMQMFFRERQTMARGQVENCRRGKYIRMRLMYGRKNTQIHGAMNMISRRSIGA